MKVTQYFLVMALGVMLMACSGTQSTRVASLQKGDKQLSCGQVQLEINEAEFYRKQAIENKSPGLGVVVAPLSYISTYMNAGEAQSSADDRIDYLNRIYEINRCDEQHQRFAMARPQPAPFQPAPVIQQMAPADVFYGAYGQPKHFGGYQPQPMMMPQGGQQAFASPIAYEPANAYYYTY